MPDNKSEIEEKKSNVASSSLLASLRDSSRSRYILVAALVVLSALPIGFFVYVGGDDSAQNNDGGLNQVDGETQPTGSVDVQDVEVVDELLVDGDRGEIVINNDSINARLAFVRSGTTIVWQNSGDNNCEFNLSSDGEEVAVELIQPDSSFEYIFNDSGNFLFECVGQQGIYGAVDVAD